MAIDMANSTLLQAPAAPPQPELLVSAVLHLMSHYSANAGQDGACVKLASVIERHLRALAGHGDLSPVLRATCQQLSEQWGAVVERSTPRPQKLSLFGRYMRANEKKSPRQGTSCEG